MSLSEWPVGPEWDAAITWRDALWVCIALLAIQILASALRFGIAALWRIHDERKGRAS